MAKHPQDSGNHHNKRGVDLRHRLLLCAAILFAGLLLRLAVNDFFGLDSDDMYSLTVARNDPATIVEGLFALRLDIHPPLHYLALHAWENAAGDSLLSLRMMNILLELLAGAAIIRLAGRLCGPRAGLFAGLLCMIAPLPIFAEYLIRMYTLLLFFVTWAAACLVEAIVNRGRRRFWWIGGAALCSLGAIYTHSIGVLAFGVLALTAIICFFPRWRDWAATGLWFGIAGVLSLPYTALIWNYYRTGKRLGAQLSYYSFSSPFDLPGGVTSALTTHRLFDDRVPATMILLAFVMLTIAALRHYRRRAVPLVVMWWASVGAIAAMAGLTHIYKPFYFAAFAPLGMALLGGASLTVSRQTLRLGLALALVGLLGTATLHDLDRTLRDDPVAAVQFVEQHERPGDLVLVVPDWAAGLFNYYYHGDLRVQGAFQGIGPDMDLDTLLPFVTRGAQGVWVVRMQMPATDPGNLLDAWFGAHGVLVTKVYPMNVPISYFDLTSQRTSLPDYAHPLAAQFGNVAALRGVYLPVDRGSARDTRLHPPSNWVQVVLYWESLRGGASFQPRVRFTDANGQVYGGELEVNLYKQHPVTSWQPGQIWQVISMLNINPDTPPGVYNIEVTVIDPASGQQLPAQGADAGASWVIAGHFTIQ